MYANAVGAGERTSAGQHPDADGEDQSRCHDVGERPVGHTDRTLPDSEVEVARRGRSRAGPAAGVQVRLATPGTSEDYVT